MKYAKVRYEDGTEFALEIKDCGDNAISIIDVVRIVLTDKEKVKDALYQARISKGL